ncbi:MAG: NADP-dependent malic enzyme [Sediminibacterium sp.]|nr:NADP-dependent malic enzyme [Sediminibacterium sp.]
MTKNDNLFKSQALEYHSKGSPGKISIVPTKETKTQRDLSLAYSPGVAFPCLEIKDNPHDAYKYTTKGNLVGVITNGTAVLGLGNIGPEASKPVMEGKGVLFKMFADIDVFDLEVNESDPDKFVDIVASLEPTFGGINLEDIKAPECFYIEQKLIERMNIPVMHDDQHGTAIISSAGLLNALEIQHKNISKVKFVVNGAGAAAMACCRLYVALGGKPSNFTIFDINGVLHKGRTDISENKKIFLVDNPNQTLSTAMKGADVFIGLSVGNVVTKEMVKSMAKNPIVFALANPTSEISYEDATSVRDDIIVATGRSDRPNQVNNVLGFPYIFRGALDIRATHINEEMKLAAVKALAYLAKLPVPEIVNMAYNQENINFGREYIIPKPFDPRLLSTLAPAVAKAGMESGVSRIKIHDFEQYKIQLNNRLGLDNQILRVIANKIKGNPLRLVFVEAENPKIIKAATTLFEDGYCKPILLGNVKKINDIATEIGAEIQGIPIIDILDASMESKRLEYGELYFEKRKRKGVNKYESIKVMRDRNHFGIMMVEAGDADAMLSGLTKNYSESIRPAIQIIGTEPNVNKIAGVYILLTKHGPLFLADATVNLNPNAQDLADIVHLVAKEVRMLNIEPVVAMLSFSNFGDSRIAEARTMAEAVKLVKAKDPTISIDGELQAGIAFDNELLKENYPFCELIDKKVNILIFPNLSAGNIAYNLLKELGNIETIGPVLLGLNKPVHILQLGSSVNSIMNMAMIAVLDAQQKQSHVKEKNQPYIKKKLFGKKIN